MRVEPGSTVAIDAKSEERTFRSEANGFLPLSRMLDHKWFDENREPLKKLGTKSENDFETAQ